ARAGRIPAGPYPRRGKHHPAGRARTARLLLVPGEVLRGFLTPRATVARIVVARQENGGPLGRRDETLSPSCVWSALEAQGNPEHQEASQYQVDGTILYG